MATNIITNTYYRENMIIKETIVDGDIYEIVEQYLDETGELIYEYKHDYAPEKLQSIYKAIQAQEHDLDYYGAKGVLRLLDYQERKKLDEARQKAKEARVKKEKNKAQYNAKIAKKLEKNRKRG